VAVENEDMDFVDNILNAARSVKSFPIFTKGKRKAGASDDDQSDFEPKMPAKLAKLDTIKKDAAPAKQDTTTKDITPTKANTTAKNLAPAKTGPTTRDATLADELATKEMREFRQRFILFWINMYRE
jgi:hypothetical protein